MITTKQQKNRVLKEIGQLEERLNAKSKPGVPKHIVQASKRQIKDAIEALKAEVQEFDDACKADIEELSFTSFEEFHKLPIKIRLAMGMTRYDFGKRAGLSASSVKRYEAAEYANASFQVVEDILTTYHLSVSMKGHTRSVA